MKHMQQYKLVKKLMEPIEIKMIKDTRVFNVHSSPVVLIFIHKRWSFPAISNKA